MRLRPGTGILVALCLIFPGQLAQAKVRFAECDALLCYIGDEGAQVAGSTNPAPVANEPGGENAKKPTHGSRPSVENTVTPACPGNNPNTDRGYDISCNYMITACPLSGRGAGPMTWVWSRPLADAGRPAGPWVQRGQSCNVPAAAVAAVDPRPVLTVAAIRDAFRQVKFAKPTVHVQPEGNVTLVNLPTYYRVQWPAQGVQPDEVATVQLLGRSVRIRPLSRSFVYRFGDGESTGPTQDMGGRYPDGAIRHTYAAAAKAAVRVDATYGGEFSVDGGPWQEVGDTVQIDGPVVGVQVRETRTRLEAG